MNHTLIELDDRGRQHFFDKMDGDYALLHALRSRYGRRAGRVYSFWPADASGDDIYSFESGIVTSQLSSEGEFAEYVREYLLSNCNNLILQCSEIARKSATWLSGTSSSFLYHEDEAYRFLVKQRCDLDSVIGDLREGLHAWHNLIVFTFLPNAAKLNDGDYLDSSAIQMLASNAIRLAINAYDYDSFLLWDLHLK